MIFILWLVAQDLQKDAISDDKPLRFTLNLSLYWGEMGGGTCYYEFEILNARELSKTEYTPRFETSPNIFWQLALKPVSKSFEEINST